MRSPVSGVRSPASDSTFDYWRYIKISLALTLTLTSNCHNSATRHPIDFVFGSRLGCLLVIARIALFNLTAHELHELYYDRPILLTEALDRLRVRLNMYLVRKMSTETFGSGNCIWRLYVTYVAIRG